MIECKNCEQEIDDEAFKKGTCTKCGQEFNYGSNGCAG